MATQYTEEFKKDAVRYWKEHPELGIGKCAKNLGVSKSALSTWGRRMKKMKEQYLPGEEEILKVMKQKKLPVSVRN